MTSRARARGESARTDPGGYLEQLVAEWNARPVPVMGSGLQLPRLAGRRLDRPGRCEIAWRTHQSAIDALTQQHLQREWRPVLVYADQRAGYRGRRWTRIAVLGPVLDSYDGRVRGVFETVPEHARDGGSSGFVDLPYAPSLQPARIGLHGWPADSVPSVADAEVGTAAADAIWLVAAQTAARSGRVLFGRRFTWTGLGRLEVSPAVASRKKPASAGGLRERPQPRLVRDAREAEEHAAAWVRWLGWPKATVTAPGSDGGVDVTGPGEETGSRVVAQVKFEALPTGRPKLQELFGAGHGMGADAWLFFSSAGYTPQAVSWAERVGMALFRFAFNGDVDAINEPARSLLSRP